MCVCVLVWRENSGSSRVKRAQTGCWIHLFQWHLFNIRHRSKKRSELYSLLGIFSAVNWWCQTENSSNSIKRKGIWNDKRKNTAAVAQLVCFPSSSSSPLFVFLYYSSIRKWDGKIWNDDDTIFDSKRHNSAPPPTFWRSLAQNKNTNFSYTEFLYYYSIYPGSCADEKLGTDTVVISLSLVDDSIINQQFLIISPKRNPRLFPLLRASI